MKETLDGIFTWQISHRTPLLRALPLRMRAWKKFHGGVSFGRLTPGNKACTRYKKGDAYGAASRSLYR